jgi:hypothetical protein
MSRMMREYHVRICEGLGVKFPGPTRHERSNDPRANSTFEIVEMQSLRTCVIGPAFTPLCLLQPAADKRP